MTAPSRPVANSDSRNEGWFGPSHATRSPLATPSVRRPLASRRPRSATSEYVSERFPAIRATALGAALARRSIHEPMPTFPKAVCAVIANPPCRQPSRRGSRSAGPPTCLPAGWAGHRHAVTGQAPAPHRNHQPWVPGGCGLPSAGTADLFRPERTGTNCDIGFSPADSTGGHPGQAMVKPEYVQGQSTLYRNRRSLRTAPCTVTAGTAQPPCSDCRSPT
jgi:hypothetical protein